MGDGTKKLETKKKSTELPPGFELETSLEREREAAPLPEDIILESSLGRVAQGFAKQLPNPIDVLKGLGAGVKQELQESPVKSLMTFGTSVVPSVLAKGVVAGVKEQAALGAQDIEAGGLGGQVKSFGRTFAALLGFPGLGQILDDIDEGKLDEAVGGALSIGLQAIIAKDVSRVTGGRASVLPRKFRKVNAAQAADLIADEISSRKMTPAQATASIAEAIEGTRKAAGAAYGAVVENIAAAKPQVQFTRTLQTMRDAVNKMSLTDPEKYSKAVVQLTEEINFLTHLGSTRNNFQAAHLRRIGETGMARKFREMGLDTPAGFMEKANQALTEDILDAIKAAGQPQLANAYIARSHRYGIIKAESQKKLVEKILSPEISIDAQVTALREAEQAIESLDTIFLKAPVKRKIAQRAIFEDVFFNRGGFAKDYNPRVLQQVFGDNGRKVQALATAIQKTGSSGGTFLTLPTSGKLGTAFFHLRTGQGKIVKIRASDIEKALDNPAALDALIKAARTKVGTDYAVGLSALAAMSAAEQRAEEQKSIRLLP